MQDFFENGHHGIAIYGPILGHGYMVGASWSTANVGYVMPEIPGMVYDYYCHMGDAIAGAKAMLSKLGYWAIPDTDVSKVVHTCVPTNA